MLHILSKMESPGLIHCYLLWGDGASSSLRAGRAAAASLSAEQTLLWELPRFGLELVQRGCEMRSRDYTGYRLAQCQQLVSGSSGIDTDQLMDSAAATASTTTTADGVGGGPCCWYTLPEFQQYMVLERGADLLGSHNSSCARVADTLVLVPVGEVQPPQAPSGSGGLVCVKLPGECSARLKVKSIHTLIAQIVWVTQALSGPTADRSCSALCSGPCV